VPTFASAPGMSKARDVKPMVETLMSSLGMAAAAAAR